MNNEQENTISLSEFYKLLEDHDWTYNYSDDQRYYAQGVAEADTIAHTRKISAEHDKLYRDYINYRYNDGEKPEVQKDSEA